jgi:hypothetical protein
MLVQTLLSLVCRETDIFGPNSQNTPESRGFEAPSRSQGEFSVTRTAHTHHLKQRDRGAGEDGMVRREHVPSRALGCLACCTTTISTPYFFDVVVVTICFRLLPVAHPQLRPLLSELLPPYSKAPARECKLHTQPTALSLQLPPILTVCQTREIEWSSRNTPVAIFMNNEWQDKQLK